MILFARKLRMATLAVVTMGCLLPCARLCSQHEPRLVNVQHLGTAEGLPHKHVYWSFQDSRGFMWFNTEYGLSRFDGQDFIHFTKEKNGLPSNRVSHMIEDETGILWVISYAMNSPQIHVANISFIDVETLEVLPNADLRSLHFPFPPGSIKSVLSSAKNKINLFTEPTTYYAYEPPSFHGPEKLPPPAEMSFRSEYFEQPIDTVLKKAVKLFDCGFDKQHFIKKGNRLLYLKILDKDENGRHLLTLHPSGFTLAWQDSTGQLEALPMKGFDPGPGSFLWAYPDPAGPSIWFSENDYLTLISFGENGRIEHSSPLPPVPGMVVNDIYFGHDGTTWISTSMGIYMVSKKTNYFRQILKAGQREESGHLVHSCRGMLLFGDSLLVSAYDDEYLFDLKKKGTRLIKKSANKKAINTPLLKRENGKLVTGQYNGLYFWDSIFDLSHFVPKEGLRVWSLFSNSPDTIMIGSTTGLFFWKKQNDRIEPIIAAPPFQDLNDAVVYHFHETPEGHLLLATTEGIFELNEKQEIIDRYWTGGKGKHHLPHDRFFHIYASGKNTYWLASDGGGLIKWDKSKGISEQYTKSDGLPSNIIYAACPDRFGRVWMPTYEGLTVLDTVQKIISVFTEEDGITHNEFNRISHLKAPDGRLFFGGLNGVNLFDPKNIELPEKTGLPLFVTKISQYDKPTKSTNILTDIYLEKGKIIIGPQHGSTHVHVAMLDFENLGKLEYFSKITGLEKSWQRMPRNIFELDNLPPGKYMLQLKGRSKNGTHASEVLSIPIEVRRAYYQNWWFYFLCFIGFVFFMKIYTNWRTGRLRHQKEKLDRLVQARAEEINRQKAELEKDKAIIESQAKKLREMEVKSKHSKEDLEWLGKFEALAAENLGDPHFKAKELASAMNLSRTQCYRKLKALTDMTPGVWLQETRMEKALHLLENKSCDSVKAVAYEVGINPNYFSEAFKKRYGKLPSDYF